MENTDQNPKEWYYDMLTSNALKTAIPLISPEPSRIMKEILDVLRSLALSDLVVVIMGEAGTEKEWLARRVHDLSGRANEKFVALDCANFDPESMARVLLGHEDLTLAGVEVYKGIIEGVSEGTLFLDNIISLSSTMLKKIASIIEYQQFRRVGGSEEVMVRVRFVLGASKASGSSNGNNNLEKELSNRLSPLNINLPPLKDRREDIAVLIKEYIAELQQTSSKLPFIMSSEALRSCWSYDWPGNAQELKMVMEHTLKVCIGNVIQRRHLPEYLQEAAERNMLASVRVPDAGIFRDSSSSFTVEE